MPNDVDGGTRNRSPPVPLHSPQVPGSAYRWNVGMFVPASLIVLADQAPSMRQRSISNESMEKSRLVVKNSAGFNSLSLLGTGGSSRSSNDRHGRNNDLAKHFLFRSSSPDLSIRAFD
jgi:hypothetical protein